jgi:hypothetical protein
MQTDRTASITGRGIDGKERRFTFNLLDAKTGLELIHNGEFLSILMASVHFVDTISGNHKGIEVIALAEAMPRSMDEGRFEELTKEMLMGALVEYDKDTKYTIGEDGNCLQMGDPIDHYLALSLAMMSNFPKYVPFATEALKELRDTDQEEGEAKTGTPKKEPASTP